MDTKKIKYSQGEKGLPWIGSCPCGKLIIIMNKYMILFNIYYFSNPVAVEYLY